MATTASLLKTGPVFMSWKYHQQFSSRQISSNNNFFSLKKKSDDINSLNRRNPTELRLLRVSKNHSISIVSSNLRYELSRNYSKGPSNLQEEGAFGDLKKLVCSSNNLFGDNFGSMSVIVEKLSRNFASLLLQLFAGLVLMIMAMALRSRDSAFAASNGRTGGKISRSYKSSKSKSSSGSSSCCCYPWYLCDEDDDSIEAQVIEKIFVVILYTMMLSPFIYIWRKERERGQGSVLMLQVGILDKKRVLQRKLNTIAETADTSTARGLNQLLNEVSKALLQHHDSCHFVYFFGRCSSMKDSIMPSYRLLAVRERERYDRETFMNVDGVKLERTSANKANSIDNEYSVVTVLVLARGRYVIPSLTVDSALQTLCSIPRKKIEAVEVLWSPQSEGDTVSEQELRRDFPHMRCCYDKDKKIPQNWWESLLQYFEFMVAYEILL